MPRLFTAVELPEDVRDQLADLQKPLPGARWTDSDDMHLTLRFVGDVEGRPAREFVDLLAGIEANVFELRLDGLGTFGGSEPRTLWAGVSPSPQLDALQRANDRAARSAGLPAEARGFRAHVTIARLKGTSPETIARYLGQVGAFRSRPFVVERFVLLSAKPKVGGGPYVLEASYALHGGWDFADEDAHTQWS